MEYLQWQIDGEFICNIARTWFWDENRPYEKSEELLLSALGTDEITLEEKKKIAQDIIEGRKKLVGINTFTLEEDNEHIRPILEKIAQLNRKLLIKEIEAHMELYAIRYVDPYSTVKSIKSASEIKNVTTYDEVYNYFCFGEFDYYKKNNYIQFYPNTKCGLWLLDHPEIVADYYGKLAPLENSYEAEEFWESIYEAIKDIDDNEFKERNKKYLITQKLKKEKEERKLEVTKNLYKNIRKRIDTAQETIQNPNDMDSEEYINYLIQKEPLDLNYRIIPDDFEKFEGLISPDGKFYSCKFGGHNIKAYYIMLTFYDKFGFKTRKEAYENNILSVDKALDRLIEFGWMATRYLPTQGCYLSYKNDIYFRPTKEQIDTIWKAIVKHDVKVHNIEIIL